MKCKFCSKMFTPSARMKLSNICDECNSGSSQNNVNINTSQNNVNINTSQNNVNAKDIDISRGQATILKDIANLIPKGNNLSTNSLKKALQKESDLVHIINNNWGTSEHFINLVLDQKNSNPISLIIDFLNLKDLMNEVPRKEQMNGFSKFEVSEYEEKFGSWELFLDLLGFDPWYRKETIQKEIQKPLKISKKQFLQHETNYFNDNDSFEETIEKISKLRNQIEEDFRQRDSEENYSDYSYVEMFQLLEKYLKILPNKSIYGNIKNLI